MSNNDNNYNDDNLTLDNFERPITDGFYIVSANPERKEYNTHVPIKTKPFNGAFAVKKRIQKLKSICDSAFLLTISVKWGTHASYSEFRPDSKDGYAEILFDNRVNMLTRNFSETAFNNFQSIFLSADRIDIRRNDFKQTAVRLYVNDIWVNMDTSLSMEREELLLPNEVEDYWESIRNEDFSKYLVQKNAVKAAMEDATTVNGLINWLYSFDDDADPTLPASQVDKSLLPKVMADYNVVRDAILNLHYNYGIGTSVEFAYIDAEMANRIGGFYVMLDCVNAALFDTEAKMKLFKRCVENCCSIELSTKSDTGTVKIIFCVHNKYRKL